MCAAGHAGRVTDPPVGGGGWGRPLILTIKCGHGRLRSYNTQLATREGSLASCTPHFGAGREGEAGKGLEAEELEKVLDRRKPSMPPQ